MEHFLDIDPIVRKYLNDEPLSPAEQSALDRWITKGEGRNKMLEDFKSNASGAREDLVKMENIPNSQVWDTVHSRLKAEGFFQSAEPVPMPELNKRPRILRRMYLVAASVIIAIIGSAIVYTMHRTPVLVPPPTVAEDTHPTDVAPGGNRATLTLADGHQINLDSKTNGVLASQGTTKISKLADGKLAYDKSSATEEPLNPAYNVLSTPRAGQFSVTLSDGSKVWLNNASVLRYPVAFTGATREVELSGEGYFEIAKDATHPFHVKISNTASTIEVLGTSFNIMAYADENAQHTTLIDGSVRFVSGGKSTLLKPNQQSILDDHGNLSTRSQVDVSEVTAWKEGYFHFDHASLEKTMRQLARWYDVNVEYRGTIPPQQFMGKIERNIPLSAILRGLENDNVHFKLEGKNLIVTP